MGSYKINRKNRIYRKAGMYASNVSEFQKLQAL